jgi:transcriptional regulator with XRE-family HTH domain
MAGIRRVQADRIRTERKACGWDKPEMARQLAHAAGEARSSLPDHETLLGYVKRWERGAVGISERYRMLYARAFGMTEDELFDVPEDDPSSEGDDAAGSFVVATVPTHAKDDDVERRQLLQLAAVVGIESAALVATGEPVRQLLTWTVGSEFRHIEDWHLAVSDHLHALRTRPPVQVRDGLAVDLLAVERQLSSSGDAVELHRIVAMLAVLYAHALTRLAEHGAALRWWRTARAAADASGDLDLRVVVRCEEAGVGLYGQRDPETVLGLVGRAQALVNSSRLFWLGDLKGTEAKALALLGRHQEAETALNTFVDLAAAEAPNSPIPALWKPDRVHFAESWVYAHRGDEARADEARNRVLSYRGDYQYAANVRLHEALCTVVNGGVETGVRQATEILSSSLSQARHTQMITETGRRVLLAVPPEHQEHPAVRDMRALIAGAPQR